VARIVPEACAALGPIGVLVNNASGFELDRLDSVTRATWDPGAGTRARPARTGERDRPRANPGRTRHEPGALRGDPPGAPPQRATSPEEIAAALRFIIASPSMTGQLITLDGGRQLGWLTPSAPNADCAARPLSRPC
jgi:NAD(P)-dependent dehydrogenase (short-subunit alcohol dehydrogenase family)